MGKPTYYLWRSNYSSQEEYEYAKDKYTKMGFRVAAFWEGQDDQNLQEGIWAVTTNHINGMSL